MAEEAWNLVEGEGPLVATAVHNGHGMRGELEARCGLSDAERLREEDPFTGTWTSVADTSVVVHRSRFEVDLNRPREKAVYLRPEDAWGLDLWKTPLTSEMLERSLALYDSFYDELRRLLERKEARHGRFVIFDIHSYNHRREEPAGFPAPPEGNPEVNLGTGNLDREMWGDLADAFMSALGEFDFGDRHLDVRENVRFRGGHLSKWVGDHFPRSGCVLAIEVKKFFMDEWTGEPFPKTVDMVRSALGSTISSVLEAMNDRRSPALGST